MVHDVVVSAINAAIVRRMAQRGQNRLVRLFPDVKASRHPTVFQIQILRAINAAFYTALAAISRTSSRSMTLVKVRQCAHGRYFFALFADQLAQNIHIVTTLCQNHGA